METLTLEVAVPKDLFAVLGLSRPQAAEQLKEFSILGLYRERRISAGKAAEMLELNLSEFVRLLARKEVPYFDYSPEDFAGELCTVAAWKQKDGTA
jgi:predicted HTH domain antitoxin